MLATMHSQHQPITDFTVGEKFKKESIVKDCEPQNYDTVESPLIQRLIGESSESEESVFRKMKYECNRLYSFQNKWPINSIKPESLAESGFFYLQHEDKVQCPFCGVILYNWTCEDKPLREHIKKSPKCPFLMGNDVGNVSRSPENNRPVYVSTPSSIGQLSSYSTISSYKPKHPRMADIKRRLLTYSDWPLHFLKPQDLAECGLYYTGVSDVVKCFFCAGSLGNWEMTDDPWEEHSKYFPDCAYLALTKKRHARSRKITNKIEAESPENHSKALNGLMSTVSSDIVKQALDIFPEALVIKAVKTKNGKISSLQDLCDDILELKQKSDSQSHSPLSNKIITNSIIESPEVNGDTFQCKICMDRDRSVVFQPCGHLISCWNCAQLVKDCPVCRRPILNIIKTYFS